MKRLQPIAALVVFGIVLSPSICRSQDKTAQGTNTDKFEAKDLTNRSLTEESIKTGKEVEALLFQLSVLNQLKGQRAFASGNKIDPAQFSEAVDSWKNDIASIWTEILNNRKRIEQTDKKKVPDGGQAKDPPKEVKGAPEPLFVRLAAELNESLHSEVSNADQDVGNVRTRLRSISTQLDFLGGGILSPSIGISPAIVQPQAFAMPQSFVPQSFVPQSIKGTRPIPKSAFNMMGANFYSIPACPKLNTFFALIRTVPEQLGEKEYEAAVTEISGIPQKIAKLAYPESIKVLEKKIDDQFLETSNRIERELRLRKEKSEALTKQLAERDSILTQNKINIMLVYAVYCMIAAIICAIIYFSVSAWWNRHKEGRTDDKILYELLGMGFLLLTIIILGTAKVLNAEGLSSLLGTISGYILGRKMASGAASNGSAAPATLPGSSLAAPSNALPTVANGGSQTPPPAAPGTVPVATNPLLPAPTSPAAPITVPVAVTPPAPTPPAAPANPPIPASLPDGQPLPTPIPPGQAPGGGNEPPLTGH